MFLVLSLTAITDMSQDEKKADMKCSFKPVGFLDDEKKAQFHIFTHDHF